MVRHTERHQGLPPPHACSGGEPEEYRQVKPLYLVASANEYIQTSPIPAGRPPPDVISYAAWLYCRFNLSHRRCAGPFIEDLLAERGVTVSREAIRLWHPKHSLRSWGRLCIKFGAIYSRRFKRKHRGYGDTFFIDEVFVKINGKQHFLWRAVDQGGEVVDAYLQAKRDGAAVQRFFKAPTLPQFSASFAPCL